MAIFDKEKQQSYIYTVLGYRLLFSILCCMGCFTYMYQNLTVFINYAEALGTILNRCVPFTYFVLLWLYKYSAVTKALCTILKLFELCCCYLKIYDSEASCTVVICYYNSYMQHASHATIARGTCTCTCTMLQQLYMYLL